mgnify:CR=1 FL=1
MTVTVAGCDCGKSELYVCVLNESDRPKNFKQFGRSYKPLILKPNREGIDTLLALPVDAYAIEPTGSYSYIWIEALQSSGKLVRVTSSTRVRHFCRYQGVSNKGDRLDAAAIAVYTLENYDDDSAFLSLERFRLRELYLNLNSTIRSRNPLHNRLGQRLGYECPEVVSTYENSDRPWLKKDAPALFRALAGENVKGPYSEKRAQIIENTMGRGISPHTRALAAQLCGFHNIEWQLEQEIDREMSRAEFQPYHAVFDRFEMGAKCRAAILSRIYPFEQFLNPVDGRPVREYVYGENSARASGKTKRDRSEAAFKLSLGMGKILIQSGSSSEWKAGGSRYCRTALWLYVKTTIVIHRKRCHGVDFMAAYKTAIAEIAPSKESPWLNAELIKAIAIATGSSEEVTGLRIHYHCCTNKKGDRRTSATAGRMCRMLYKALVKSLVR